MNQAWLIRSFVNYSATLFQLGVVWEVYREWGAMRILMEAVSLESPRNRTRSFRASHYSICRCSCCCCRDRDHDRHHHHYHRHVFIFLLLHFIYILICIFFELRRVLRFKLCVHFPTVPCVLRVFPIPYFLILSPWYLKNTNYETFREFFQFLCFILCVRSKYSARYIIL